MVENLFFELLQVSVGNRQTLSQIPSEEEWRELYALSKKHSLVGICFYGLKQLPKDHQPPLLLLRQWTVKALKLEEKNKKVNDGCRLLSEKFAEAGFDSIILKGQGNRANYPEIMRNLRTPGDIDVWMKPKDRKNQVRSVIEYCLSIAKGDYVYYHNMDFPVLSEIPVEVHYRPSWLFCPWRNLTLQKWMNNNFEGIDYDGYKIPTTEFNVVFQLIHINKHLFEEGIGLRQLLDYYYALNSYSTHEKKEVCALLNRIGMMHFTGAIMYVLANVFACSNDIMLCEPREKEGKQLLNEIMIGGNFGHFDTRYNFSEATISGSNFHGPTYAWLRLKHNFRFLTSYPLEVLFEPPFRFVHYMWRTFRLWRY